MLPASLDDLSAAQCKSGGRLRVGLDVVEVNQVRGSLRQFGQRYLGRLFTEDEIGYAFQAREQCAERLAARFAAKEAAIKAFSLSEVGVSWRDIEVRKHPDGGCRLALHGEAAREAARLGVTDIALSLSHDGDYAGAVVTALCTDAAADPVSESN
jgi:holo-[acyl-carrier protein] synthase